MFEFLRKTYPPKVDETPTQRQIKAINDRITELVEENLALHARIDKLQGMITGVKGGRPKKSDQDLDDLDPVTPWGVRKSEILHETEEYIVLRNNKIIHKR